MKKRVLVTGGTSGIGKQTALELAKLDYEVILLSRSAEKGERVRQELVRKSGNPDIKMYKADLSSFSSIRSFAYEFKKNCDKLDVLVNNAGVYLAKRYLNEDGIELTFATNHLGPFLLTNLLLDLLKKSNSARIINVSSAAHAGTRFDFDDYNKTRKYSGFGTYGESKLCNVLHSYELADRLKEYSITSNVLHPGFIASSFAKNNGLLYKIGVTLLRPFAKSVNKGAETSVYLASSDEVEGITGKYFVGKKMRPSSNTSQDKELAMRLWELSEKLTKEKY